MGSDHDGDSSSDKSASSSQNDSPGPKKTRWASKIADAKKWSDKESMLLVQLYRDNHTMYHSTAASDSKKGLSIMDQLATEWAETITEMSGVHRTKENIKAKLLDLKKPARQLLAREKRLNQSKKGSGLVVPLKAAAHVRLMADVISTDVYISELVNGLKTAGPSENVTGWENSTIDVVNTWEIPKMEASDDPDDEDAGPSFDLNDLLEQDHTESRGHKRKRQMSSNDATSEATPSKIPMTEEAVRLASMQEELELTRFRRFAAEEERERQIELHTAQMELIQLQLLKARMELKIPQMPDMDEADLDLS